MTHDQIREMVRRVNPIPDPSTLEIVDVPVLTTPLERRIDMQIDDRPGTEVPADRNRRRGPLVGIAAAAAILIAGLVFVVTRDNAQVAEPAPNATLLTDEGDALIDPGAYFADTDGEQATSLGGTFVIEFEGWTGMQPGVLKPMGEDGLVVSLMVAEVDKVWSPVCGGGAPQPAGTSSEDLANQFAAAGFTVQEAVSPVSAFGQTGYHLVIEVPPGCVTGDTHSVWEGPNWGERYYQAAGQVVEYWFLDVEGTTVMVEASSASGEADVSELRAVLDTLVITP
jgi:hypothetical protein